LEEIRKEENKRRPKNNIPEINVDRFE